MRQAVVLLGAAAAAVVAGGAVIAATWHVSFGHGLYCSLGTASTVGCDVAPPGTAGRLAAAAVMLTAIPLLAAAFASLHLDQVRKHVDASLGEHRRSVHTRLDRLERGRSGEKGAL